MTNWRFILIVVVLTKMEDRTLADRAFKRNSNRRHNETMDIEKRLSEDVLPSRYVIAISTDFRKDEFRGSIGIDIDILRPQTYIALHSKNLTILSTKLYSGKWRTEVPIKSVLPVDKREMLVIKTFRVIPVGKYVLKMNFSGDLNGKIKGFYLSKYTDLNHSVRKLAVTQFEPLYAREAFPCFDEPSFKSTFVVRLLHSEKPPYHALSNMPVAKVETTNTETITYFDPTPPMSTYLVAFLTSDFDCLGANTTLLNGTMVPLNVCARPMYKHKGTFALNVAIRVMEYYLSVFNIDYPLPKLDMVAIPDFSAGAMENWGLITFRETELLHSENDSSCLNTRSVSLTVAHELAHMWFGNLVTMRWWNDLWLNEGFATYMEHMAVDYVFPEWNEMDSFPLHTKYVSMKHDSRSRARAIVKRVEDPEEIEEMFDRISYQKAAAVIRMLEDAIGNSRFVQGIRSYLDNYRFKNAESRELFELLSNKTRNDVDIIDFMNRWTMLAGFPMVNVVPHGKKLFRLSQQRFTTSKKLLEIRDGSWTIPIKYITSRRNGVKLDWFIANYSCVELSLERPVDWIKLNHGSIGYYVVNYTEEAWRSFRDLLSKDHRTLSPVDRADLLHDAFLLAGAADLRYSAAMNLTSYLAIETAYQPWAVAVEWFTQMNRLLARTRVHERFQSYARRLVDKIYHRVGWNIHEEKLFAKRELGVLVLNAACSVAHKHCLDTAGRKLREFLANKDGKQTLPADIRSIVYTFGLVTQSDDVGSIFENMSRLLAMENDAQERERLIIGLTAIRDKDTLNRYLERATDGNLVRKQDFTDVLIKVAMNPAGVDVAWNFIRSRWTSLVAEYNTNGYSLGKAVVAIVSSFKDRRMLQEARRFFLEHELGVTESTKRNAIEEIENSIKWLDANVQNIDWWLAANGFD
ncbi:glutamyl aminopeptidase-like [Hylaeus volcanicus]|uniref:glutamyl aminopeptidase-like n=1 Tax=Hylaeus volcanicus TaxID=313075 RepID=UPI0023B83B9E|nr:glutamyl aminopeptidase-like [Hylaeus volcanicus]